MKEVNIKIKPQFDYKSVNSGVEQINSALKNINIEDKVRSKLENYIKNVNDKLADLSRMDVSKKGTGAYRSALKDVEREYGKLSKAASEVQLKDISFPKETIQQITNITNALEKLKLEREKLIESFQNTYAPTQKRFAASLFDKTSDERTRLRQSLESKQNERYERKVELSTLQKQTQSKINEATSKLSTETDDTKKASLEEEIRKGKEELEKYNAELKNLNTQIKQTQTQLSILNSFKDSRQAVAANKNANEIDNLTKELEDLNKSANDAAKQGLENFHNAIEKGGDAIGDAVYEENKLIDANEELNKSYDSMKKRVANVLSFAAAFRIIGKVVRETINTVSDFDKTFTNIAMVAGKTRDEMWGMFDTFNSMANKLGVTTKSVMESSKLFYQQGLDTNEVLLRTEATVKLATISGMDFTTATNQMTAALNGFNLEGKQANEVSDIFANLAAKAAVDVSELSEALTKTASIAKSAGMSIDTTSAFLTKMIETTREAPENIGTAMKTIVARMQELKNSPTTLLEDGVDANKVEKALKEADVALRDSTGQFRNLDDVLLDLGSKWEGLDRNTQRYIATIIAGSRQQSRLLALLDDNARTVELVEIAQNSQGAATIQQATNLDSVEASLNRLTSSWEKFKTGLLNSNFIKGFYDFANGALKMFDRLGIGLTVIMPLMTLLGVKIASFIKKNKQLKSTQEDGSGTKKLINLIKERVKAWFTEEQAIQKVIDKTEQLRNTNIPANPTNATNNTTVAAAEETTSATPAATPSKGLGNIDKARLAVGAIGTAIGTIGKTIISNIDIFAKTSKAKEEKETKYQEASSLSSQKIQENTELNKLIKTYNSLNSKTIKTAEDTEKMAEILKEIKDIDSRVINDFGNGLKTIDEINSTLAKRTDEQLKLEQQALMADPVANNAELQNLEDEALKEAEQQTEVLNGVSDAMGGIGSVLGTLGMAVPGIPGLIISVIGAVLNVGGMIVDAVAAAEAEKAYENALYANKEKYAAQYGETAKEYTAAELEKSNYAGMDDASKEAISNIVGNMVEDEVNALNSGKAIKVYEDGLETFTGHISSALIYNYNKLSDQDKVNAKILANATKYTKTELDNAINSIKDKNNTYIVELKKLYAETADAQRTAYVDQLKTLFGDNVGQITQITDEMTGEQLSSLISSLGKLSNDTAKSFGKVITTLYSKLEGQQAELINKISNMDFNSLADIVSLALMGDQNSYNQIITAWAKGTTFTSSGVKQTELDLEANFKVKEEEFDKIKKALSEGISAEDKQKIVENYDLSEEMFELIDGQWVLAEEYQGRAMKNFEATALYTAKAELEALKFASGQVEGEQKKLIEKQINSYNSYIANLEQQIVKQAIDAVKKETKAKLDARKDYLSKLKKLYEAEKKLREQNESREELAEKEAKLAFLMQDQTGANAEEIASLQKDIEKDRENLQEESIQQYFDSIQQSIDDETESLDNINENSKEVKDLLDNWQAESTKTQDFLDIENNLETAINNGNSNIIQVVEEAVAKLGKDKTRTKLENSVSSAKKELEEAYASGDQGRINKATTKYNTAISGLNSVKEENEQKETNLFSKLKEIKGLSENNKQDQIKYETSLKQEADRLGVFSNYSGQQISSFINNGFSSASIQEGTRDSTFWMVPDAAAITGRSIKHKDEDKNAKGYYYYTGNGVTGAQIRTYDLTEDFIKRLPDGMPKDKLLYDSNTKYFYGIVNNKWARVEFNNGDKRNTVFSEANTQLKEDVNTKKLVLKGYSEGGYVTETGPVMVHGTPNKPEAFLSAEDTAMMREFLNAMGQNRNFNFRNNNIPQKVENHTNIQNILNLKIEKVETEADIDEVMRQVESKFNEMSDRISVPYIR